MKFDRLHRLLLEGLFHVPQHVYKDILNYYNNAKRTVAIKDIKRITDKQFPPKLFKIDFSGTRFEFLNSLGDLWVKVELTLQNKSWFNEYENGEHTVNTKNRGNVLLDLKSPTSMNFHIVEHEILHFVQALIQKYKKQKGYKNTEIGGLPPKKFIPTDLEIHGYKVASKRSKRYKRIAHTKRPIEYYTDLLSAVRYLQYDYDIMVDEPKPSKEEYFKKFVKDLGNFKNSVFNTRRGFAASVFNEMRQYNPEVYRLYLKHAYKAFVYGKSNFNALEIQAFLHDLTQLRLTANEIKDRQHKALSIEDRIFDKLPPLKISYYDRSSFSNLDDGNFAFAEDTFDALPYVKRKPSAKTGDEFYYVSMKWPHIRTIFNKIRSMRDRESDEELKRNYVYFANLLFKWVFSELKWRKSNLMTPENTQKIKDILWPK